MPTTFRPRFLQRLIAIDHACAWPNLTLLPNGDIVTVIWPEPCHGYWEGAVECWGSQDGGCTWTRRSVPVPHTPGTNRLNVAAGLANDGALVTIISGWEGRTIRPERTHVGGFATVLPIPARSMDGGYTWTAGEPSLPPADELRPDYMPPCHDPKDDARALMTPFGDIMPLPDGTLGVMIYSSRCNFYVSADGGLNWTFRGPLGILQIHNETTWLPLSNDRFLAVARTDDKGHLEQFISTDQGRTWNYDQSLTEDGYYPAGLTALTDGTILLTYGIRLDSLFGIGARISHDQGKTWSEPRVLVDLEDSSNPQDPEVPVRDGGYPSSVQLADGTIVTAYYCKGVSAHQRYHMGVLRWTVE